MLVELHPTSLRVKGEPLHVEVAKPFHSERVLVADLVGSPVEEEGVVQETLVGRGEAVIGVGDHLPEYLYFYLYLQNCEWGWGSPSRGAPCQSPCISFCLRCC